jgi:hypothetical protein
MCRVSLLPFASGLSPRSGKRLARVIIDFVDDLPRRT